MPSASALVLILALAPAAAGAPGLRGCLDSLDAKLSSGTKTQHSQYLSRAGAGNGIKRGNESKLFRGTRERRAILLAHGFLASPFEVEPVAKSLNQRGYTVLAPLIRGFGSSAAAANAFTAAEWRGSIDAAVSDLASCFPEIALIGFSLGGGLVADFAFNRASSLDGRAEIARLALLSPYLKPAVPMSALLNRAAQALSEGQTVPLSTLLSTSRLAGSENRDLLIPLKYPRHYTEAMPLKAVDEILGFSEALSAIPQDRVLAIPAFLAYSEADQTIDWRRARDFVSHHFQHSTFYTYSAEKSVAHQIALADSGADPKPLIEALARYLE